MTFDMHNRDSTIHSTSDSSDASNEGYNDQNDNDSNTDDNIGDDDDDDNENFVNSNNKCPCPPYPTLETLWPDINLKRVFYSGDSWVVLCQENPALSQTDKFKLATRRLKTALRFLQEDSKKDSVQAGILDCSAELEFTKAMVTAGGRATRPNTLEKFRMKSKSPLAILFAYGERPVPLSLGLFSSPMKLAWKLRQHIKPSIYSLTGKWGTTKALKDKCITMPQCLLIIANRTISKSENRLLLDIRRKNKRTAIAVINATSHLCSLESVLVPLNVTDDGIRLARDTPRILYFKNRKVIADSKDDEDKKNQEKRRQKTQKKQKKQERQGW